MQDLQKCLCLLCIILIYTHAFPDEITADDLAGFEKRCKPEKVEPCANSTFGCCPDEFFAAKGPFGEGCIEIK